MIRKNRETLKLIVILSLLFVSAFFIFKYWNDLTHINIRELKKFIISYGIFSALIFVIIYSVKPIALIIPASVLSILAGNIFGAFFAFILSIIGCFFAGSLAFFLSRILGKSFVDKVLKGKLLSLDDDIEKHGFKIMLLMRLSFVFPYDALSYAAGLTKMRYEDFILGTVLGVIPEMFAYSFIGSNIGNPFSINFILPILIVIFIATTAYVFSKKGKKKKRNHMNL